MTTQTQVKSGSLAPAPWETSAALTAAESAPSSDSDGIDCKGYSQIGFSVHTLTAVTAFTVQLWLQTDGVWVKASDADGVVKSHTGTSETMTVIANCAPFDRAAVQLTAITGTSLKHSIRAVGPGL